MKQDRRQAKPLLPRRHFGHGHVNVATRRPVSGLAERPAMSFPEASLQWSVITSEALVQASSAYRCGGSSGEGWCRWTGPS
jgi:hypothetical protein